MKRFGVVGWKNTGKTTLLAALVAELTARGLRVSTVKRASHGFEPETAGSDSFLAREAGAAEVIVASPLRVALMRELRGAPPPSLDALVARLDPVDLVLVEGFKGAAHPKIEMMGAGPPLWPEDPFVVARAAADAHDQSDGGPPVYARDDVAVLADLALEKAAP